MGADQWLILLCLLPFSVFSSEQCAVFSPSIDGCSDFYFDSLNYKTDFKSSCNNHDYCYRTIGKSKSTCDYDFEDDLISSCNNKYLRYEAYEKVDEICIGGIILGVWWACLYTEDIYNWVETTVENATRVVQLQNYPECLVEAELYYYAVDQSGIARTAYNDAQDEAVDWAKGLAQGYFNGSCSIPSASSNLFALDKNNVINSLYNAILDRTPIEEELENALAVSNQDPNWEYHVINTVEGRVAERNAVLVAIITSLLL